MLDRRARLRDTGYRSENGLAMTSYTSRWPGTMVMRTSACAATRAGGLAHRAPQPSTALWSSARIPRGDLMASEEEISAHWQAHPSHADEPGTHYWLSMLRSVPALRTAWASPSLFKYTNTSFPLCCHSRIRSAHHIRLP